MDNPWNRVGQTLKMRTLQMVINVRSAPQLVLDKMIFIRFCLERKWKCKSLSRIRLFATPWTMQSMKLSRPEYWSVWPFPSTGDLPNPEIEPRSPTLQMDFLPDEPEGKPKNTRVGSQFLLQQIFLSQELNQGLLHCRQILYQLCYWGFCLNPWHLNILFVPKIINVLIAVFRNRDNYQNYRWTFIFSYHDTSTVLIKRLEVISI